MPHRNRAPGAGEHGARPLSGPQRGPPTHLLSHPVGLTPQGQGVLGVLVLQVVHEGIALAVGIRLLEAAERLQALGCDHRVPPLGRVHQPHVGEAPAPAARAAPAPQGPVLPRVLCIVRRQHGGAAPLRICERGEGARRGHGAPGAWGCPALTGLGPCH